MGNLISGWYEGEYGANQVCISDAATVEDLADVLYTRYGEDCVGVDMELDGEFADGSDIADHMDSLWDELDFLSAKGTMSAEKMMDAIGDLFD